MTSHLSRALLLIFVSVFAGSVFADGGTDRPNALSVELFGRGILYSLNYDRALNDDFSLGAGFSRWGVDATSSDGHEYAAATVTIIPIYVDYYFYRSNAHRWFVTGGLDFISASFAVDDFAFAGSTLGFTGGAGYEYRGRRGFLFRGNLYVIGDRYGVTVWPGLSLGYAF